jgi:AcrR family transcriptional regulator
VATRPGRPRDPAIDEAIRTATQQLLLEIGHRGLSMGAVAARAGVSKPTLYLRYPSKQFLIFDAVFGRTKALDMPETGSLRRDLLEAYGWAVAEFAAPEARATLPALLAEMPASPEFVRLVRAEVIDPEYARVESLLRQARERGEVREDADLTLVVDAFLGAALARAVLLDRPLDHDFAVGMVDLLIEGLRPRPDGSN